MSAHNRVMFVDDEEGVRVSWDRMLTEYGFDVTTVTDGARAVSELEAHPMDVIVADWKMPVMDGLELLEWVRDEQPETRFILLTGYGDEAVERRARELGAYEYLNKPIGPETLAAIVTAAANLPQAPAAVDPEPAAEASAAERVVVPERESVEVEASEAVVADEPEESTSRLRSTAEIAGGIIVAPVLGLAFVIALPVIGFFAFAWYVGQLAWRALRPAGSSA
ncbi:MAG: response regulator [Longimicrobiales bacterium]|nr:response regulator [Longimicrobiales bacterium]